MKFNHSMLETLIRGLDHNATVTAVAELTPTTKRELVCWQNGNTIAAKHLKRFADTVKNATQTFFVIEEPEESFMVPATNFGITL